MKKLLLSLISLLLAFNAIAQEQSDEFTVEYIEKTLKYEVISLTPPKVSVGKIDNTLEGSVEIPETVTYQGTTYTVTSIRDGGFGFTNLTSITIPNNITYIGDFAFRNCSSLTSVTIPNSVTSIGGSVFYGCSSLTSVTLSNNITELPSYYDYDYYGFFGNCSSLNSVTIPNSVTSIGGNAFKNCGNLLSISFDENSNLNAIPYGAFQSCTKLSSIAIPKNVTSLGMFAFMNCNALATVIFEENSELTTISTKAFYGCSSLTSITIPKKVAVVNNNAFQNCYNLTSVTVLAETAPPLSGIQFAFGNTPDTKTLTVPFGSNYSDWEDYTDWGQVNYKINAGETKTLNYPFLITTENKRKVINDGVMVIGHGGQLINETNTNIDGVIEVQTPVTKNQWHFVGAPFAGYTLGAVKPVAGSDVAMVKYDYTSGAWSNDWATFETPMEAGEGIFAWPFYDGEITFSTYNFGESTNSTYPADAAASYALNNGDVTVTKTITASSVGNWMALSNPYPAKLSVSKFLNDNALAELTVGDIQGEGVYLFNGTSFDYTNSGDILMTEGFFVNFASASANADDKRSVVFKKSQLKDYPTTAKGAKASANEFIELTLQNGNDKVRVYLAHNEDAEQGYDILDANKMFATTGVAEPYFVTDGIALIKEEVRDLPYYATMNVRSQEDTVMNFVLTNLPEGYAVSIIDGEEVIDMVEGGVYSTEIASGENADRFKVLVKKNVGLADVEELDVRITNSNRHIAITAQENVKVSVYNTLGQKVFETEETNFVLSGVASGAYVVKVQGAKAAKSQKIIVE